jgi:hypothetical protein
MPCRGCHGKAKYGACESCGERWCAACVSQRRAVAPFLQGIYACSEARRLLPQVLTCTSETVFDLLRSRWKCDV